MAPKIRIAHIKSNNISAVSTKNDIIARVVAKITRHKTVPVKTALVKTAKINNEAIAVNTLQSFKRGVPVDKLYSVGIYQKPREARPATLEERYLDIIMQQEILSRSDKQ